MQPMWGMCGVYLSRMQIDSIIPEDSLSTFESRQRFKNKICKEKMRQWVGAVERMNLATKHSAPSDDAKENVNEFGVNLKSFLMSCALKCAYLFGHFHLCFCTKMYTWIYASAFFVYFERHFQMRRWTQAK